uniref:Putative nuclease HARBI1 n=1 Tax=Sphaeramia orbicularis TaxID=375764 RepID=A0A672Y642_9TELE
IYRLPSNAILELPDELGDNLRPVTRRSHAIPSMTKLLAMLHFLASGSFQRTVAICAGISQSSFCCVVSQVLNAMSHRMGRHIQFPLAGFPRVIGAIDCTHVQLVPPSDREHVYRNRKHTHSLNVQNVCDSHGVITNVVAKYPGSVHDSFILRNSVLFSKLRDGEYGDGWILGDSAHPLHPYLLTPVLNLTTPGEHRYSAANIQTRNAVEHTFDVLKSQFRCLDRTGGALLYSPEKVAQIMVVYCILHIAKHHGMEHNAMDVEENEDLPHVGQPNGAGMHTRANLIESHFLRVI